MRVVTLPRVRLCVCICVCAREAASFFGRANSQDDCRGEMVCKVVRRAGDDVCTETRGVRSDGVLLDSFVEADELALA